MSKTSTKTIVSIGYERRTPDELVKALLSQGVRKLLDVRELPISRRRGFSKTALSLVLGDSGIQYHHIRTAGNPYRKHANSIERCLLLYAGYLNSNPEVVDMVVSEIDGDPVAFLCYERDDAHCHRSVLMRAIIERGHMIKVIQA